MILFVKTNRAAHPRIPFHCIRLRITGFAGTPHRDQKETKEYFAIFASPRLCVKKKGRKPHSQMPKDVLRFVDDRVSTPAADVFFDRDVAVICDQCCHTRTVASVDVSSGIADIHALVRC